jgi:hypothetical protein
MGKDKTGTTVKTKFTCPKCKGQLVLTSKQSKPHCRRCGFVCRRAGNSMQDSDRRHPRQSVRDDEGLLDHPQEEGAGKDDAWAHVSKRA